MHWRTLCLALVLVAVTTPRVAPAQRIKLPEKLETFEERAVADSNDASAHYNLGLAYWSKKRYDDAEGAFRVTIDIDPKFAEAYLALAYLPYARRAKLWEEISEGRVPQEWKAVLEESDRLYRQAFLINPLVDLKIIGAVTPSKSVYWEVFPDMREFYRTFFQGFDDILQGKYDHAYFKLERLIDELDYDRDRTRTPGSLLWYHALAAAHIERYDEAIRDMEILLERELEEEGGDALIHVPLMTNEYRYFLATFRHRAGQLEEARRLYREALEQDIGLYMAHVQLARIHESREEWPEASEEYRRAIAVNPEDPSLLYDLGVTLGRANHLAEAEESLLQAEAANPRDARIPYVLGLVRVSRGNPYGARESFERFIAIAPSRFEAQVADAIMRIATLSS